MSMAIMVMTMVPMLSLHGFGSSNCAPVLPVNIEVGHQRMYILAKYSLDVNLAMLTRHNLHAH